MNDAPAAPDPLSTAPPPKTLGHALLGLLILVVCHVLVALASGFVALLAIGLVQLAYVIPGVVIARKSTRPGIATGLIIGAALTFILNAGCYAVLFIQLANLN